MQTFKGFISITCKSDSSKVLLVDALYKLLSNSKLIKDSKLFSLKSVTDNSVYYIYFECDKEFSISETLYCTDIRDALTKIALLDIDLQTALRTRSGDININNFIDKDELHMFLFNTVTKVGTLFCSLGIVNDKRIVLTTDKVNAVTDEEFKALFYRTEASHPNAYIEQLVTELPNSVETLTDISAKAKYSELSDYIFKLNLVSTALHLESLDFSNSKFLLADVNSHLCNTGVC